MDTHFPQSFPDVAPPTHPLGQILSVRDSEARVALPAPAFLEQSRATVGAFLCVSAGPRRLIGMITEVEGIEPSKPGARDFGAVERWRAASGGPRSVADEPSAAEMEARAEPQPGPTHDRPEPDVPSRALPTSAFSRIEQIRAQMLRRGRTSNA